MKVTEALLVNIFIATLYIKESESLGNTSVSCGGHYAVSCSKCTFDKNGTDFGRGWCNADCIWLNDSCVSKDLDGRRDSRGLGKVLVSCGSHFTTTCSMCPFDQNGTDHGEGWCNGDCKWNLIYDYVQCNLINACVPKDYRVGPWKVGCKQTDIYKVAIGVMGGVIMLLIGIIVYTITHGMRKPGEPDNLANNSHHEMATLTEDDYSYDEIYDSEETQRDVSRFSTRSQRGNQTLPSYYVGENGH